MSTIVQIEYKITSPLNGGEVFDNAKIPQGREIWNRINTCRAALLGEMIEKSPTTVIDDAYLSEFTPVFDSVASQGKPFNIFSFYELANLPNGQALFWIGKDDRITQFDVVESMGELSTYGMHSVTDPRRTQNVVCCPRGNTLIVYNKDLKNLFALIVADDPTQVAGYNILTSTYPVDARTETMIVERVQKELSIALGIPLNYQNNAANEKDLATIPVIPK